MHQNGKSTLNKYHQLKNMLDAGYELPNHVAIIMDGNGRWASKRYLPRVVGHREGVKSVRAVVEAAGDIGIDILKT